MNDQDIRVIKTREDIASAFFELLQKKPMHKISVAELCQTARIHKSTFYRHYLDIPDLRNQLLQALFSDTFASIRSYTEFFDAPEAFLTELDYAFQKNVAKVKLLAQDQEHLFFEGLVNRLSERIFETGRLEKTGENSLRLEILFSSFLINAPKHSGDREQNQKFHALLASLIRSFFSGKRGQPA